MIAYITYSKSLSSNANSFYGEAPDSVLIAYDDLRTATKKMVQLNYEIEKNKILDSIVKVDSVHIHYLEQDVRYYRKVNNKYKKQRNIAGGTALGLFITILGIIIL